MYWSIEIVYYTLKSRPFLNTHADKFLVEEGKQLILRILCLVLYGRLGMTWYRFIRPMHLFLWLFFPGRKLKFCVKLTLISIQNTKIVVFDGIRYY